MHPALAARQQRQCEARTALLAGWKALTPPQKQLLALLLMHGSKAEAARAVDKDLKWLIHGFFSGVLFYPERSLGMIVLTNSDGHDAVRQIMRRVINVLADVETLGAPEAGPREPTATPMEWREFLGTYESFATVVGGIESRDGALHLVAEEDEPPVKLDAADDPDVFVPAAGRFSGEVLRFRRNAEGQVTGLNVGGFPANKLVHANE